MYDTIEEMIKDGPLIDCGRIKVNRTGSPSRLIATWKVPKKDWNHELGLTLWIKSQGLLDFPIVRGPHVDPRRRSDGTFLGSPSIDLEFDKGTETWKQLRTQFIKYEASENFVLVITESKRRMEGIQSCLADLGLDGILLFTHKGGDRIWSIRGQEEPTEELWKNSGITPDKKLTQGFVSERVTEESEAPNE